MMNPLQAFARLIRGAALLCLITSFSALASDKPKRILINTAESFAHHYSGGLGVMIDAYMKALSEALVRKGSPSGVTLTMPFYMSFYDNEALMRSMNDERREIEIGLDYAFDPSKNFMAPRRTEKFRVFSRNEGNSKILFYRHMNRHGEPNYFDNKVGPGERKRYAPEHLEKEAFAAYSKALAIDILRNQPEVALVTENDWHTGLNAYFLKHPEFFGLPKRRTPRILGLVHNYEYQGEIYNRQFMDLLGIDTREFHADGVLHGAPQAGKSDHLNYLKALLNYSDMTATVSAQHASEVLTRQFGKSMEGVNERNARAYRSSGILNGIDVEKWNPEKAGQFVLDALKADPRGLESTASAAFQMSFTFDDLSGKTRGKEFLQRYFGLAPDPNSMVIGFTSRLDKQKGYDYVPAAIRERLIDHPRLQIVVIGDGPEKYRGPLASLQREFPGRLRFESFTSYKEHLILSFADAVGAFSEHEPSGQVHTAAMRMGTVPIATAVGGHVEAITDADGSRTGFLTHTYLQMDGATVDVHATQERVSSLLDRAIRIYESDPKEWTRIAWRAAQEDFAWSAQIEAHLDLIEFTLRKGPERLLRHRGMERSGTIHKPSALIKLLNQTPPETIDDCVRLLRK